VTSLIKIKIELIRLQHQMLPSCSQNSTWFPVIRKLILISTQVINGNSYDVPLYYTLSEAWSLGAQTQFTASWSPAQGNCFTYFIVVNNSYQWRSPFYVRFLRLRRSVSVLPESGESSQAFIFHLHCFWKLNKNGFTIFLTQDNYSFIKIVVEPPSHKTTLNTPLENINTGT